MERGFEGGQGVGAHQEFSDSPRAVEDERGGPTLVGHLANRVGGRHVREIAVHPRRAGRKRRAQVLHGLVGDTEHDDVPTLGKVLEVVQLLHARLAPRRPEGEDDDAPGVVREAALCPVADESKGEAPDLVHEGRMDGAREMKCEGTRDDSATHKTAAPHLQRRKRSQTRKRAKANRRSPAAGKRTEPCSMAKAKRLR